MEVMDFNPLGGIAFVAALFVLYRVLVQQKDANIATLKDQLSQRDAKIKELESQTPDALLDTVSRRIKLAMEEIDRLNADKDKHSVELTQKQSEMTALQEQLSSLTKLIRASDLVCPTCGAPLIHRVFHTITGYSGGSEVDADVEYREYQCGYSEDEGSDRVTPCRSTLIEQ
jgi:hypothetical protein